MHDFVTNRGYLGALFPETMDDRVEHFAEWASALADRLDRPHEVIPEDRHERLGTARFHRTLAWHIARRPGGLVVLAIQYGHLRTAVAAGYASRSRDGLEDLLDIEIALATAETLTTLNEDLADGIGISGPAARRAIHAAGRAQEFIGAIINVRQAGILLNTPDMVVYDNPSSMLMCVYKHDTALCHRGVGKEDRCRSGCVNIARTDRHAHLLVRHADHLDKQAAIAPKPIFRQPNVTDDPPPELGKQNLLHRSGSLRRPGQSATYMTVLRMPERRLPGLVRRWCRPAAYTAFPSGGGLGFAAARTDAHRMVRDVGTL